MSATRYHLAVYRETSIGVYAEPEFPDLPAVSQDAFDVLAWQDLLMAVPRATWHGKGFDAATDLGEAFIAGHQDAALELVPLLQWCRQNTSHGDIAELLPSPEAGA